MLLNQLAEPPLSSTWLLLGLWLVGGLPFCAHRLALRKWGFAAYHSACAALAVVLIGVALLRFDPSHIRADIYVYEQAYEVGLLSSAFASCAGALWLTDGVLLLRSSLYPSGASPLDYEAPWDPLWQRLAGYWLVFGLPFGAHRWWMNDFPRAVLQCGMAAFAVAFALLGQYADLSTTFATMLATGVALLSLTIVLWFRDLIQLCRGRLGDPQTPTPFFWLLLGLVTIGGVLGLHRFALRRWWSAPLCPLLFGIMVFGCADARMAYSGWKNFEQESSRVAVLTAEVVAAATCGATLLGIIFLDSAKLLRGRLRPNTESDLYWRVLYSWITLGLPIGLHRLAAGKASWKLFPILNGYGALLLLLSEFGFKPSVGGDPTEDPQQFHASAPHIAEAIGRSMWFVALVMWLRDSRAVWNGLLPRLPEDLTYWSTVNSWLLPTGYIAGLHFVSLGRPLDWQLYTCFSIVGSLCGFTARWLALPGKSTQTYLFMLITSIVAFSLNAIRFVKDGAELQPYSVLSRKIHHKRMKRARQLYSWAGYYASAHKWYLGQPIASVLSVSLTITGATLAAVGQLVVARKKDTITAYYVLGTVASLMFLTTGSLWVRDGWMLIRGKVATNGEKLQIDIEIEDATALPFVVPKHWRRYTCHSRSLHWW